MRLRLAVLFVGACTAPSPKPAPVVELPAPPPTQPVTLPPPPAEPMPQAKVEAPAPPDPNVCEPKRAPKPLAEAACVDEMHLEGGRTMGFSQDGKWLGYCISVCDPCPADCTFVDATGRRKNLAFYYAPSDPDYRAGKLTEEQAEARRKAKDAASEKFLSEANVPKLTKQRELHGKWKYDDLVVATRTTESATRGTTVVEVGARVDGGQPVYVFKFELGPHPMWKRKPPGMTAAEWHEQFAMSEGVPAVIDVTPDGKEIGVVAFAAGSMWFESADMSRMPIDAFAAKVYEESARAAEKSGDAARAADLRERAKKARAK